MSSHPPTERGMRFEPLNGRPDAHFLTHGAAADIWIVRTPIDPPPSVRRLFETVHKILRVEPMSSELAVFGTESEKNLWQDFLRDYYNKINQWASLEHENVVRVLGVGDGLNLRVEMCEQGSVREYLKTKIKLQSYPTKLDIVTHVLEGLTYLHTQVPPIVHGNLNAGKLFIDAAGTTKIGEFGLASLCYPFSTFVPSISFVGLVRWSSPELLNMNLDSVVEPTTGSDIWALGCVFLEIVTETIPYSNCKHDMRVRRNILAGEPPAQHSEHFKDQPFDLIWPLLKFCWEIQSEKRPSVSSLREQVLGIANRTVGLSTIDSDPTPLPGNLPAPSLITWPPSPAQSQDTDQTAIAQHVALGPSFRPPSGGGGSAIGSGGGDGLEVQVLENLADYQAELALPADRMADHSDDLANPLPSPRLVEIPLNEYQGYYCTRHGRLFPRHRLPPHLRDEPDVQHPSVLPVDPAEMERREVQHNLVALALHHQNWFGPFVQHLTPPQGKVVLDIGSASGKWIDEVSEEPLQDVRFHGVEIVPLPPVESTNHTVFEVYDFQREGIRQSNSSVDVIHARFQNFHILDWKNFLQDVARVLKPGGLFMSGELDIPLEPLDGQTFDAPATEALYTQVQNLMRDRGYTPEIGIRMPRLLGEVLDSQGAAAFTNINSEVVTFPMSCNNPIQDRREISELSMECLDRLAKSLRPFLLSTGQPSVEVDGLLRIHRYELRAIAAQMNYRITWAERR